MIRRHVLMIAAIVMVVLTTTAFAADKYQWNLADSKDNCQIYTSAVAGKEYVAAKTTCVIPARIEVLETILRDIENYPKWMEDCKETKILKTIDDANDVFIFWFRQHVDLLKDRDMVLKSKVLINSPPGTNLVYADSTNEMNYDSGKGYVRMPSFYSLFTLEWIDREHTRVTFMIDPDLGPGVPVGIANMTIKKIPFKTLKNMAEMAKETKYIEAAKTSKYFKLAEEHAQRLKK